MSKKILVGSLIFILLMICFSQVLSAEWVIGYDYFDNISTGNTGTQIESAGSTIIALFQVIAIGVAVVMLVVTGIMYVLSATSDKKAEMKKHLPNYIVGVIFTFSAAVLLQIVREFINDNINP